MKFRTLSLVLVGSSSISFLFGQGGGLDPSFGSLGTAKRDITGQVEQITAADITPSGKIYGAGYAVDQNVFRGLILKMYADGSPDNSFDGDGAKLTGQPGENIFIEGIKTAGEKPVTFGYIEQQGSPPSAFINRDNEDGTPDATFNGTGSIELSDPNTGVFGQAGLIDNGGNLYFAGKWGTTEIKVNKYDPSGSLITSWGTSGTATIDQGISSTAADMKWNQNPGDLIVFGYTFDSGDNDMFAAALNSLGNLNTSFGNNGIATLDLFTGTEILTSGAVQADDKLLMAGFVFDQGVEEGTVRRLNADGSLDQSFGVNGEFRIDVFPGGERISGIEYADDKIFVAGHGDDGTSQHVFAGSLNYDGTWNTAFGSGIGYVQEDLFNDELDEIIRFLYLTGNYKMLMGGSTDDPVTDLDALFVMMFSGLTIGMAELDYPVHSLKVYPDPLYGNEVNLEFELNSSQDLAIGLYELSGKHIDNLGSIENSQVGQQNVQLQLPSSLAPGTYMIGVNNGMITRFTTIRVL